MTLRSRFSLPSLTLGASLFSLGQLEHSHAPARPTATLAIRGSRVGVGVASKLGQSLVAVASRFGDSKEGSFLFLSISFSSPSFHCPFLSFASPLPLFFFVPARSLARPNANILCPGRAVNRNQTRNVWPPLLDFRCSLAVFWVKRTTPFLGGKRLTTRNRASEIWSVEDFRGELSDRRCKFYQTPAKRFPGTLDFFQSFKPAAVVVVGASSLATESSSPSSSLSRVDRSRFARAKSRLTSGRIFQRIFGNSSTGRLDLPRSREGENESVRGPILR